MKNILLSAGAMFIGAAGLDAQVLIAGWDFQTTTNGGTAAAAAPAAPFLYTANFGSGTLYLNGTNGSSTWTSAATNPQVTSFGGTAINAATGFSTTTTGAASLALANSSSNGLFAVFKFSMTGYEDLVVSYASQSTSTGFNLQTWEYSVDGSAWFAADTFNAKLGGSVTTSFATVGVVSLDAIVGLDNAPNAYLRLSLSGASNTSGNNRFDNIQFNAATISAVPEPSSFTALAGMGALGFCAMRRRRSA